MIFENEYNNKPMADFKIEIDKKHLLNKLIQPSSWESLLKWQ